MRKRRPSAQTMLLLETLLIRPMDWRYGYDLMKETGVSSGTLYPILMRLAEKRLLESVWHKSDRPGAPARHAYRLTQSGVGFAMANLAIAPERLDGPNPMPA